MLILVLRSWAWPWARFARAYRALSAAGLLAPGLLAPSNRTEILINRTEIIFKVPRWLSRVNPVSVAVPIAPLTRTSPFEASRFCQSMDLIPTSIGMVFSKPAGLLGSSRRFIFFKAAKACFLLSSFLHFLTRRWTLRQNNASSVSVSIAVLKLSIISRVGKRQTGDFLEYSTIAHPIFRM